MRNDVRTRVKYNSGVRTLVKNWIGLCLLACVAAALFQSPVWAAIDGPEPNKEATDRYRLEIDFDYHAGSFTGRESIKLYNRSREEVESVYFILYPNVGLSETDAPWLTVRRIAEGPRELRYSFRSRNSVLKVDLPQKLAEGRSIELTLEVVLGTSADPAGGIESVGSFS